MKILAKTISIDEYGVEKLVHFKYKKYIFRMTLTYRAFKNTTYIEYICVKGDKDRRVPKIKYCYHTKTLNIQQHINNLIIDVKEWLHK